MNSQRLALVWLGCLLSGCASGTIDGPLSVLDAGSRPDHASRTGGSGADADVIVGSEDDDAGGLDAGASERDARTMSRADSGAAHSPDAGMSDDLQHCIDLLNSYRAMVGVPALRRAADLEAYAATGARQDGMSGQPHGHFSDTNGGGISFAENEIPQWPLDNYGSVRAVIEQGTQLMWSEGPGGGHYENIRGDYTVAGCGVFVGADRSVTVVQDFR